MLIKRHLTKFQIFFFPWRWGGREGFFKSPNEEKNQQNKNNGKKKKKKISLNFSRGGLFFWGNGFGGFLAPQKWGKKIIFGAQKKWPNSPEKKVGGPPLFFFHPISGGEKKI